MAKEDPSEREESELIERLLAGTTDAQLELLYGRVLKHFANQRERRISAGSNVAAIEFVEELVSWCRREVPGTRGPGYALITYARRVLRERHAQDVFDMLRGHLDPGDQRLLDELLQKGDSSRNWNTVKNVGSRQAKRFKEQLSPENRLRFERWLLVLVPPVVIAAGTATASAATKKGVALGAGTAAKSVSLARLLSLAAAALAALFATALFARGSCDQKVDFADPRTASSAQPDASIGSFPRTTATDDDLAEYAALGAPCDSETDTAKKKWCLIALADDLLDTRPAASQALYTQVLRITRPAQIQKENINGRQYFESDPILPKKIDLDALDGLAASASRLGDDAGALMILEDRQRKLQEYVKIGPTDGVGALGDCYAQVVLTRRLRGSKAARETATQCQNALGGTFPSWSPIDLELARLQEEEGQEREVLMSYIRAAGYYPSGIASTHQAWEKHRWRHLFTPESIATDARDSVERILNNLSMQQKAVFVGDVAVWFDADSNINLIALVPDECDFLKGYWSTHLDLYYPYDKKWRPRNYADEDKGTFRQFKWHLSHGQEMRLRTDWQVRKKWANEPNPCPTASELIFEQSFCRLGDTLIASSCPPKQ